MWKKKTIPKHPKKPKRLPSSESLFGLTTPALHGLDTGWNPEHHSSSLYLYICTLYIYIYYIIMLYIILYTCYILYYIHVYTCIYMYSIYLLSNPTVKVSRPKLDSYKLNNGPQSITIKFKVGSSLMTLSLYKVEVGCSSENPPNQGLIQKTILLGSGLDMPWKKLSHVLIGILNLIEKS